MGESRPGRLRAGLVIVLWVGAFALAALYIASWIRNPTPLGQPWQESNGNLLDFRDLVTVPGRYLLEGGNPYNPGPYLAAHPWAQEFDPYAPAWLILSVALGWLPLEVGAAIYFAGTSVLMAVMARIVTRWVAPRYADLAAPLLMGWLLLWYRTRVMGSTFIVVLGALLVFRAIATGDKRWVATVGMALVWLKPQFGLPLSLLWICAGQWRVVARGTGLIAAVSIPPFVACAWNEGGPIKLVQSVLASAQHASSPASPTGVLSPFNVRIDFVGLSARLTHEVADAVPLIACLVVLVATVGVLVWAKPDPLLLPGLIVPTVLLLPVHLNYDLGMAVIPATTALILARQRGGVLRWLGAAAFLLIVAHLIKFTTALGGSALDADLADVVLLAMGYLASIVVALTGLRRRAPRASLA